jgi:hypothetical protein
MLAPSESPYNLEYTYIDSWGPVLQPTNFVKEAGWHLILQTSTHTLSQTQLEAALPRVGPPGKDEILIGHSTDQLKKTLPALLNGGEKGV